MRSRAFDLKEGRGTAKIGKVKRTSDQKPPTGFL
jgi:hypothetical protein